MDQNSKKSEKELNDGKEKKTVANDLISLVDFFDKNSKQIIKSFNIVNRFVEKTLADCGRIINIGQQALEGFPKAINKILEDSYEIFKTYNKIGEKYSIIMLKMGWPPSLQIYFSEMRQILDGYESMDEEEFKKSLNDWIENKHDKEKLNVMLNKWEQNKLLVNRIPILKQVVQAHNNGQYFVSIPALLAQIEGIIVDGYKHRGKMNGPKLKMYLDKLLKKQLFDKAIKEFYLQIILPKFHHGHPIRSCLSRHAILHGGDVLYGTAINSLKCILMFDYLQLRMCEIAEEKKE